MRSAPIIVLTLCFVACASSPTPPFTQTPLPNGSDSILDLPRLAIERSQITLPGSTPFHLKARVMDPKNPAADTYRASIEEYWISPQKWRRTVTATGLSELLIVNGPQIHEEITGDYYPYWLRTMVNAIFDPGAPLKGVDLSASDDNPV